MNATNKAPLETAQTRLTEAEESNTSDKCDQSETKEQSFMDDRTQSIQEALKNSLLENGWKIESIPKRVWLNGNKYICPDIIAKKLKVTRYYIISRNGAQITQEQETIDELKKAILKADGIIDVFYVPYK